MSSSECRWGIMSSAQIARKNYQAIYHAGNARLIAVASRERAQAEDFIESCQKKVLLKCLPGLWKATRL